MSVAPRTARAERVLIVGGGIAGLSLAIALRRRGLGAEIVERADAWPTAGAGLFLVGAATRALHELGLAGAVIDEGAVIRLQTIHDHRGRRLAQVDAHEYWRDCGPCLGISRAALHRVLAERIGVLPIHFGRSVVALREETSHVSVEFTNGSRETYDLVVGADGIRSTVRRLVLGESEPRFRGQIGWRFIVRRPTSTSADAWTVFLGAGSAFLTVPMGHGEVYCYADRTAGTRDPHTEYDLHRLLDRFSSPVRQIVDQLTATNRPHQSPIEESAGEAWGSGRVVLIGDAAHAMSPNMACGAAMALEDAIVLADIIAQPGRALDVLPEMVRRRSPRVRWVWRQTNHRDRLRRLPSSVRNFVMRRLGERTYRANYHPLLAPP